MKPHVTCLMISSLDGSLATKHWTTGPGNDRASWSKAYAALHARLGGDAWVVGRVTMAEMVNTKASSDPGTEAPDRPWYFADRKASGFAIGLDPSGRLQPDKATADRDHLLLLLGANVSDAHLGGLKATGISYIVSEHPEIDLLAALDVLARELRIKRLLLEGGGGINGSFMAAGLVDEISVIIAPALDGREGKRTIVEAREQGLFGRLSLELAACEPLEGGMVHLRYIVRSVSPASTNSVGETSP